MYQNSIIRINRAKDLHERIPGNGIQKMKEILLDTANGEEAICAEYIRRHHYQVGTVSSMIMDLPNRTMYLTRGNPRRHKYQEFRL